MRRSGILAQVVRTRGVRLAPKPPGLPVCVFIERAACVFERSGDIAVVGDCTPRRLVVATVLRGRQSALDVRLAGGRTVHARVVRLRVEAGRGWRVALAILPARAAPVEVVVRGATTRRRVLRAPAAAEQCGYADTLPFTAAR